MKISIQNWSTLSAVVAFTCLAGCDYMPESLTGKRSVETVAIKAVGPTGRPSGELAEVTPGEPLAMDGATDSTGASSANGEFTSSNYGGPVTQQISHLRTASQQPNGYTDGYLTEQDGSRMKFAQIDAEPDSFSQSLPEEGRSIANSRPLSNEQDSTYSTRTDGKIVITNAHLKFVDDLEIAAQSDGKITMLQAGEGDLIAADAELIQVDARMAAAELDVATKELEAAAEKAKDKSEIDYSEAANNVAQLEFETSKELKAKNAETDQDYRKKWLEARRAALAITVAKLKNNQDIAAVGVSEAKKRMAENQLELRTIRSPFDGIVAERKKDLHDWVRAGDVIMRLVSLEKLRVIGSVNVSDLQAPPHRLLGAPATINIRLYPGASEEVQGRVGFVSPVMESSKSYKLWIEIPNKEVDGQWLFREGMMSTITIDAQ